MKVARTIGNIKLLGAGEDAFLDVEDGAAGVL